MSIPIEKAEVVNPLCDGIVTNWDVLSSIYDYALRTDLGVDPHEHPLLAVEPPDNTNHAREMLTELAFENLTVPAFFVAKSSVLASFASGKPSALVVDCGASRTVVSAVHEGYCLRKSIVTSSIAGRFITEEFLKELRGKEIPVRPRFMFKRKEVHPGEFVTKECKNDNITASYTSYATREICDDIKLNMCSVSQKKLYL